MSARELPFSGPVEVTRGLAYGDVDNDGDMDFVVANADNSLRFYRNDAPRHENHWLRVQAVTLHGPALGARVTVHTAERSWTAVVPAGASYASHSDPRLVFGLGLTDQVERIDVVWPDGTAESFLAPEIDTGIVVRRGEGTAT